MDCPSCGHQNRESAIFCLGCGTRLSLSCSSCGRELPAGARFCDTCGIAVTAVAQPASAPAAPMGPASYHPTSFAHGRYQVRKFLGEGGKKRVYLAYDTQLDREVAFALIKTQDLDDAGRARIAREARAMGRLGDHPNIMPIHDLGYQEGQPFMVLPLMAGGDVEGVIEKAPDHRLPLGQTIEITRQVCQGLQFAHARGIVHRDLKPGNVWLTADGTAKIGDFGLALPLEHPRMTQEGLMVGTISYMPPEQALGGEVTAGADLYSLGCMLYEMVTGRPPFLGDDPIAIIGQHINTPPVAPTWHNPQCPRPLEALTLRLLAKDPAQRPASAAEVLAALEGIDLSDVGAQFIAPETHTLDSLARGVFVGRQRDMGELKAALEEALSGKGRLVTLVGEPGIGKTRTAQELATYARLRQAQVLWGRCYESAGAPPYWPWVQVTRDYVRERDEEQLRSEMGAGAADVAEIVSDVRERLPDLKPPPQLEPEQARFRLFDSMTAFLKSAGRRQPLVLILEDLHWADRPSLLLLEFLARELTNSRLLVIGTYRDVEISRRHPLSLSLGDLTRSAAGGFQRILLGGLSQEDVGRFIELVSGMAPPPGLVEAVHRQTEGNPLFVSEVVRLLVQEGELTPDVGEALRGRPGHLLRGAPTQPGNAPQQRESWTVRIPEGVREVIGRRLDRLSDRCNQTLTIASVIGREFTLEQLNPLIDDPSAGSGQRLTEDRLVEVLDEALAARVIEELPRAVGRFQFTHSLIQETLEADLTALRRARLHLRIAQVLEGLYGADAEAHAAELAYHLAQAGTAAGTEKLVRYSLLAGERALAGYAWEEALAHFELGLTAKAVPVASTEPASDAEAAALLFGLGRAQAAWLERYQWQVVADTLGRAFDYYAEVGDVARVVAVAEQPFRPGAGRSTRMAQLIARALVLAPPDSLQAGRLLSRHGQMLGIDAGDYEAAKEAFGRALAIARREGRTALEMRTLADAARVDFFHLRWPDCLEKCLRAIELARSADDLNAEVTACYYATFALIHLGNLEGARPHASTVLALAERLRDRFWLSSALWRKENLSRFDGDWPAARGFSDRGLAVLPMDSRLFYTRALLEYEVGDFGQGEMYLGRLLEVMRLTARGPTPENGLTAMVIPMVARITGVIDRQFDIAAAAAETIRSAPSATPAITMFARVGLALMAVQRGDVVAAGEQSAALELFQGTMVDGGMISIDRILGLLAQTMGQMDKATEHFEDALAFCRKAGYRPELAWTCCDYADCLLARVQQTAGAQNAAPLQEVSAHGEPFDFAQDRPVEPLASADHRKATALLDEALKISSELGMRPLMERVLSRRQILKA